MQQLEEHLIGDLQRTLKKKNAAVDQLGEKSRALKKTMQPRCAYKYKNKRNGMQYMSQTNGFSGSDSLLMPMVCSPTKS
jgi:hypothetical protein